MKKLHLSSIALLGLTTGLAGFSAQDAKADIVHLDDVIIEFSLCVGSDCVNGESFGFDTLRLKENNLRIHFDDTSTSASFPSNDWRIVANDSGNGGANYLAIEDSTAGRQVFRVDAGAPASSLHVDSAGDVGIGTSSAVVELHVVDGDSPTLRLEQDGSSGFTPQTYDLVSNEANFFIRDVTNGSQLPFRIKPGADSDALFIAANNDIGLGTDSPGARLHLRETGAQTSDDPHVIIENTNAAQSLRTSMLFRNAGDPAIRMENTATSNTWQARAGIRYILSHSSDYSNFLFDLHNNGNLTIAGSLTTGGTTCGGGGCDRVFDEDFVLIPIEEQYEAMYSNRHLPAVGPTPENEPIDLTQKVGGMLHELEKAHLYIAQLNDRIAELETQIDR